MAQAWRLAIAVVLIPLSLLAGPVRPERPDPITRLEQTAGTYYLGRGLGFNFTLTIAPEGTFSYVWRGCLGIYGQAAGNAFLRNGELVLAPSFQKGAIGAGLDTHFLPVRWGARQYLVPSDQLLDFARQVKERREPRSGPLGDAYLRQDDWDEPVSGAPDLPEPYRSTSWEP
jgi:hypothetical protein